MVRPPSIDSSGMKKGSWSEDEDEKLRAYIQRYGHWNWRLLPKFAGLKRCGKSCRLRWVNYLKPGVKRGNFSKEEQELVVELHKHLGNKWSAIAEKLPGRTDNEIKNFWHTRVEKRRKTNHQHRQQIKKPANPTVITKPVDHNIFDIMDSSEEKASSLSTATTTPPNSLSTNPEDQLEMMLSQILEADAANFSQNEVAAMLEGGEFDYPELRYTELSCSGSSNWMGDSVDACGSFWNECSNSESETSSYTNTNTYTYTTTPVEEEGLLYDYDPLLGEYFGYETNLFC